MEYTHDGLKYESFPRLGAKACAGGKTHNYLQIPLSNNGYMYRIIDDADIGVRNISLHRGKPIRPELVVTCRLPRLRLLNSPTLWHLPLPGLVAAQRILFRASFTTVSTIEWMWFGNETTTPALATKSRSRSVLNLDFLCRNLTKPHSVSRRNTLIAGIIDFSV